MGRCSHGRVEAGRCHACYRGVAVALLLSLCRGGCSSSCVLGQEGWDGASERQDTLAWRYGERWWPLAGLLWMYIRNHGDAVQAE